MKVASIDSATRKTGVAMFEDGKLVDYHLIDLSRFSGTPEDRMDYMVDEIVKTIHSLSATLPELIYIEEPNGQLNNIDTYRKLSEIIGAVRFWARRNRILIEEVKPTVWRRHCGIDQGKKKRAELKAESVAFVKEQFNIEVNDDVADAICLGIAMMNCGGQHK